MIIRVQMIDPTSFCVDFRIISIDNLMTITMTTINDLIIDQ